MPVLQSACSFLIRLIYKKFYLPSSSLDKEIFRISVPNILSNISIPLLGIVDTALMGRMDDPAYIGAIAIGGIIFNILYWGFGFLRPGTTGLTAQAYGKKQFGECYRLLIRALILGIAFGCILWLIAKPVGSFFFGILEGSDKVMALSSEYYYLRILAAPAVLCLFAFRGWFFGMQNAIAPMVLTIVANILNIYLSWLYVMKMDMSVRGVAYGTVLAQWITFLLAILIFVYRYKLYVFRYFDKAILKAEELKRFLVVNRDMFIRNLGLILVFSFFTNYSSKMGDRYLAINQMLLELFYFMSYAIDGFAYASESLVGKYLGAGDIASTRKVIKKCLQYGLGLGLMYSLAYLSFGNEILSIFTDNENLIREGKHYLIWCAGVGLAGPLAFIWDGVYSGATASVELRNSMLLSVVLFFIVFYTSKTFYPLIAIWLAMIAFMLGRSLFQIVYYKQSILLKWQ